MAAPTSDLVDNPMNKSCRKMGAEDTGEEGTYGGERSHSLESFHGG